MPETRMTVSSTSAAALVTESVNNQPISLVFLFCIFAFMCSEPRIKLYQYIYCSCITVQGRSQKNPSAYRGRNQGSQWLNYLPKVTELPNSCTAKPFLTVSDKLTSNLGHPECLDNESSVSGISQWTCQALQVQALFLRSGKFNCVSER